jgi:hypothetical protein
MVPLILARIEDLGPGDFPKDDCAACGHTTLLIREADRLALRAKPASTFLSRLGPRRATETAGIRLVFDRDGAAAGILRHDTDADISRDGSA